MVLLDTLIHLSSASNKSTKTMLLAKTTEEEINDQRGEIPAGFLFASVKNIGNEPVIVNEVPLEAGKAKSYPFVGKGHQAIPYRVGPNGRLLLMITL